MAACWGCELAEVQDTSPIQSRHWLTELLNATPPRWSVWFGAVGLTAGVAVLDQLTSAEIDFSFFYMLPVLIVVWYASFAEALALSLGITGLWLVLDRVSGVQYSNGLYGLWNAGVHFGFLLISALLLSAIRRAHEREASSSRMDSLTGIPNARQFAERATLALAGMRRDAAPLTVAFIDVDDFKLINDTLGHASGDEALRSLAGVMSQRLRSTDLVARLGGDEFAVLLPRTGHEQAETVLQDLREAAENAWDRWELSVTIGVVTFAEPPAGPDELLSLSDKLMYRGKSNGKGRTIWGSWPE